MENIDLTAAEDTTLFTDEEQVKVNKVNHEFKQESRLKGESREFTLFNDSQCYQKINRKHGDKVKFRVSMAYLNPKPTRRFILADGWLIGSAILAVISFLLVYIGWFRANPLPSNLMIPLVSGAVTLFIITFLIGLLKTEDRIIYYSQHGHLPLLELINHNPDKAAFEEFTHNLSSMIVSTQHAMSLQTIDLLTSEVRELRRLMNEGVIKEADYEDAKKRIFSNKAFVNSSSDA